MRSTAAGALLAAALLAGGCATVASGEGRSEPAPFAANPVDPWERFNRKVFAFNEAVDEAVLKPVAEGYRKVVPQLVRTGIGNVLGNVYDVWSMVNHLLQGKVHHGLDMGMRVLTNTLFGLGGLLDPATEMGLVRRSEDFGQTLGRWGLPTGPYLVLPFLGPSSVRDGAGLLADRQVSPSTLPDREAARYGVTALEVVHQRALLLGTTALVDQVALDRYSFLRDGYLARRRDQVYDGAPPLEALEDFDDFDDEDDKPAPKDGAKPDEARPKAPAPGTQTRPPAPPPATRQ
ncbi:MAG: VacJ family lipoprotein [Rubrivivax sp.]|nr:VacJ family lipoprotein [Rubrivivax sp.]